MANIREVKERWNDTDTRIDDHMIAKCVFEAAKKHKENTPDVEQYKEYNKNAYKNIRNEFIRPRVQNELTNKIVSPKPFSGGVRKITDRQNMEKKGMSPRRPKVRNFDLDYGYGQLPWQ